MSYKIPIIWIKKSDVKTCIHEKYQTITQEKAPYIGLGNRFLGNTLQFQSPSKNNQCESVSALVLSTERGG